MLRLSSLAIIAGALWLAYTALPDSDAQRRLDSFVGISLSGDRTRVATNATKNGVLSDASSSAFQAAQPTLGRTAADVFGNGQRRLPTASARDERDGKRSPYQVLAQASETRAAIPLPIRRVVVSDTGKTAIAQISPPSRRAVTDLAADATANRTSATKRSRKETRRIARLIQRELRRVGCYAGRGTGHWGQGSHKAMARFARAIGSADLPTKPDYVNLILLETYDGQACGTGVRTRQIAAANHKRRINPLPASTSPAPLSTTAMSADMPPPSRIPVSAYRTTQRAQKNTGLPSAPPVRVAAAEQRRAEMPSRTAPASTDSVTQPHSAQARARRLRQAARLRKRRAAARTRARRLRRVESERRARQRYRRSVRAKRRARRSAGFRGSRRNWVRRAFAHRN
ncbi:MAG: hypothetical protein AAFZ01_11350 [Pseudomonadota bacterium]